MILGCTRALNTCDPSLPFGHMKAVKNCVYSCAPLHTCEDALRRSGEINVKKIPTALTQNEFPQVGMIIFITVCNLIDR